MATTATTTPSTAITTPIPKKDTVLTALRDNIDVYYETATNPLAKAGFADDNKETRAYRKGDIVGSATGKVMENKYGIWVEVTIRYWKKRVFDKIREDATAYYLLHQDPVTWDGYENEKQTVINSVKVPLIPKEESSINPLWYFGLGALALWGINKYRSKNK